MDQDTHKFIEDTSALGYSLGIPRSAARVIGYLVICEPSGRTAKDIGMTLNMPAGAVTSALNILEQVSLLKTTTRPGELDALYEIDEESWLHSLEARLGGISRVVDQANAGLKLFPDNKRLKSLRSVYMAFDKEAPRVLKKLAATKD